MRRKITDLPKSTRPIEKLTSMGPSNLSDSELLAILINTGTAKHNALSLASSLLRQTSLSTLTSKSFPKIVGLGTTKIARIRAALELGHRLYASKSHATSVITSTKDALSHLAEIASKNQEHLVVLYLNARRELIHKQTIAIGNLNVNTIEIKEILTPALSHPCIEFIIAHNHPSGDSSPSEDDIAFTRRIHSAADILGLTMFDHLILTPTSHFSFRNYKSKNMVK